jgi:hypothetical protein
MVSPLTPNPTRKAESLTKAPPTIVSRREEDVALKKWPKPWLCCDTGLVSDIFSYKRKKGKKTCLPWCFSYKFYRLFQTQHSFSVTIFTLGFRLFFILLQINLT